MWSAGGSDGSGSRPPWAVTIAAMDVVRRPASGLHPAAAAGLLVRSVGADVNSGQEKSMVKHQEFVKGVVFRAASSATLMAVVVVVVGAGKKFT